MLRAFLVPALILALALGGVVPGQERRAQAAAAAAEDAAEAQARELFRRAEVHFNLREFDRALELYAEAYRLKPLPGFLFNIAQCHRFSERYEDAAFSYRVYLQRAPNAPNRAEVEALIAEMEAAAAAQPPEPAPSPQPPAPPAPVVAPPPAPPPPAARLTPWVWGTGGLGVALVGTGLVTGQMASSRSERYRNPATPLPQRSELRDSGRALATASVATLAAGAVALGAVGWWLLVRAPAQEAPEGRMALIALPGRDGGYLGLQGGF